MDLTDWTHSNFKQIILLLSKNILLTCDWPGLRGGDRSSSEPFPLCGRLLGGDWSESEPCLALECILGGDCLESNASRFFRGGDWSESE